MALLTLPVWTIPPDWTDPVTETLEWRTGVFASAKGAEQRQSLRLSPRRAIEFTVTPTGNRRTYFDALLSTEDQVNFYVPLWHDRATLAAAYPAASSAVRVKGDRLEMRQSTVLFVQGTHPWSYDLLEVTSVTVIAGDTVFTLTNDTTVDWPKGTPVYAATIATLLTQPTFTRLSDAAFRSTIRFDFAGGNYWPGTIDLPTYRSYPVVELETDENEAQSGSYFRYISTADNSVGLFTRKDFAGIGFPGFTGANFVVGRSNTDDLRSLLYTLRGKRNAAWFACPTADFTLARVAHAADTAIIVERSGFTDLTGVVEGRRDIRIALRDGAVLYRRITASNINANGLTESIGLDGALGSEVRPESVRRISFLVPGRLDQDLITLTHTTDTDGVCGVTLAFKTVPDLRDGADWFPPPFPLSNMGDCGPTVPGRFWARIDDGPWNGDAAINPSIGEGGIDISVLTDSLFPVLGFNTGFLGNRHSTANFGGMPFAKIVPYRAAAWGVTTTWNASDKSADIVLTNGNLTAHNGSEQTGKFVRAITSSATQFGFRYYELHVDEMAQNAYVGFATAAYSLEQPLFGSDPTGSVLLGDDGLVRVNGVDAGIDLGNFGAGATIGILVYTGV